MEGLQDLGDLLKQYDWREFASAGIGTAIGIAHAVYDIKKGRERNASGGLCGGTSGGLSAFHSSSEGVLRSFGNGFLGGCAYVLSYNTSYKILDKIKNEKQIKFILKKKK